MHAFFLSQLAIAAWDDAVVADEGGCSKEDDDDHGLSAMELLSRPLSREDDWGYIGNPRKKKLEELKI